MPQYYKAKQVYCICFTPHCEIRYSNVVKITAEIIDIKHFQTFK